MSDETEPEDLQTILVDKIKSNLVVRINLSSYTRIRNLNWETFLPQIQSFGFVLYTLGTFAFLITIVIVLAYEGIFSEVGIPVGYSVSAVLIIGSIIVYYLVKAITRHIQTITHEERTEDEEYSTLQLLLLIITGVTFWVFVLFFRVFYVPGIDPDLFMNSLFNNPFSAIVTMGLAVALDLIYFGAFLIGTGIGLEGARKGIIKLSNHNNQEVSQQ
jgi:hypothetical protein